MSTYRCDFKVAGTLVLPADVGSLELCSSAGFTTTFSNGPTDDQGHATGLIVTVVGRAESIDSAQEELRHGLAKQLDLLAFTTHSQFKIVAPLRLIEWDAGKKTRNFKAFHTADARYPPDPELIGEYLKTVGALDQANPPAFARVALKYFRYGLLDDQPDDQFMRLWHTLEVIAENVPIGLGSHVHWDRKLDGMIAQALMSINAVKAVSLGPGWEINDRRGSQVQDVIEPVTDPDHPWQRKTNRAGGLEGGMTDGMPVVARFAIKPIATLYNPLPSVDLDTGEPVQAHFERSDVCQVPPAGVIGEAMMALVLADAFMEKFGGDSIPETRRNFDGYLKTVRPRKVYQ